MKYRNLAASTQRIYTSAVRELAAFLADSGSATPPSEVTRRDIEAFVRQRLEVVKAATVSADFRALQQFFKWLVREDEIDHNPMLGAEAPIVPEALSVDDVDFDAGVCHVVGKGRRGRALPFGQATALALGRYLRSRAKDRRANLAGLWLAEKGKGALEANGIRLMLRRRGLAAGVEGLHAHQFRHTAAHRWLAEGGGETDLMRIMGWKSPQMLRRYGASKADERAREAHRRMALGDKI